MDAEDLLKKRRSQQEQEYSQRKQEQESEPDDIPEPNTWLGKDSNNGQGVTRSPNGSINRGSVITNGQILPGYSVLALQGGITSFNQMPAPYPISRRKRRSPNINYRAECGFLAEIIYESAIAFPPSCETRLSAIYAKKTEAFADIGALTYKVIRYPGPHPEEACACQYRWTPTTGGCILSCDGSGEFATQQACEDFRNNPGNLPGTLLISSRVIWSQVSFDPTIPTHFTGGFPDGWTPGVYAATPYRNAYIVIPKNGGAAPVEFNPYLQKWKLSHSASWPSQPELFLDLNDCYIYPAGLLKQWDQGISIEPSADQDYAWPASALIVKTDWPAELEGVPPTGRIFTGDFIRDSSDEIQVDFDAWGIVDSWDTREIPGPPPTFDPPDSVNNDLEDDAGYHYRVHFYLSCLTKQSIPLGDYLIKADRNRFDPAFGGRTDNYLEFGEADSRDDELVDAFMCAVGEKQFDVVVKYGKFKKRIVVGNEQKFNYYWCAIDHYFINGNQVTKTTYKYPAYVNLHPNNWMAFLMRNWNYKQIAPQGINQGISFSSDKFLHILYAPYTNLGSTTHTIYNPDIQNRAIAEYLNGWALITGHSTNNASVKIPLAGIQGARIGYDAYSPEYAALIGCNFVRDAETNKWYIIDTALNQWVANAPPPDADLTLTGNILVEALRSQDCENLQFKAGEAEVTYLYKEIETAISRPQSGARNASIRIKDMKAIGGKKAFKIDIEGSGILEVQCWLPASTIKNTDGVFNKFPLYKCFMTQAGEYGFFLGDFTFAHQYPLADFSFVEGDSVPVYPRLEYLFFFYDPDSFHPELQILTFKDCAGNILRQLDGPQPFNPNGTGSYPPALVNQMNWRPLIIGGCG